MRKNDTHNKFETSYPLSHEMTSQKGDVKQSFECSETNRLGNTNRSKGCLCTHFNFSKPLKILRFYAQSQCYQ